MMHLLVVLAAVLLRSGIAEAQSRVNTLRPGDGIRLRVIGGDPSLSGEFMVDERLVVVLPKLGQWSVADIPADSIRPRLLSALSEYVLTPSIEATPYRRIAVAGAVMKPGLYPIDASMSVGDAIILAMGIGPDAKENVVERRRMGAKRGVAVPLEARVWEVAIEPGEQLVVPKSSWLRRNGTSVIGMAGSVAWIIRLIGGR